MPARRIPEREKQIAAELRELYGGAMTLVDVAAELGVKKYQTAREFLIGVPATRVNRRLRWRVSDVARRIYESMEEVT